MKVPSKKEIEAEQRKIKRLHECYRFAYDNADDEPTRKRIMELSQFHLLAKIKAASYGVEIPAQGRMDELRKKISELKKH